MNRFTLLCLLLLFGSQLASAAGATFDGIYAGNGGVYLSIDASNSEAPIQYTPNYNTTLRTPFKAFSATEEVVAAEGVDCSGQNVKLRILKSGKELWLQRSLNGAPSSLVSLRKISERPLASVQTCQ